MSIARALKRFLFSYSVMVITAVTVTVLLAFTLQPYLNELFNRWLGYTPLCGCERYAVLPADPASWSLFLGLGLASLALGWMCLNLLATAWQTAKFRRDLDQRIIQTTHYRGVVVHTVTDTEPLAVCVGYFKPAVYISDQFIAELTGFELLSVIQHEIAHAKRLDPLQRLWLLALPTWLPIWRTQMQRYLAGQEVLADTQVMDTSSIQSAFVKLVNQLPAQPVLAATWFATAQARIDYWLGQPIALPRLRWLISLAVLAGYGLLSSYQVFAAEPTAQAFGQCQAIQTMCESVMTYVVQ